jgi:hypothetical protein
MQVSHEKQFFIVGALTAAALALYLLAKSSSKQIVA